MTWKPEDSFPYFTLARRFGLNYSWVLQQVEFFEESPKAIEYWCELPSIASRDKVQEIAFAVRGELQRRARVMADG